MSLSPGIKMIPSFNSTETSRHS